ncbi:hypothetical protein Vadar_028185 [Vaccinium darrowii]|nr:hypothetical protein Vadar_028185 [Vaccinium darrowii]
MFKSEGSIIIWTRSKGSYLKKAFFTFASFGWAEGWRIPYTCLPESLLSYTSRPLLSAPTHYRSTKAYPLSAYPLPFLQPLPPQDIATTDHNTVHLCSWVEQNGREKSGRCAHHTDRHLRPPVDPVKVCSGKKSLRWKLKKLLQLLYLTKIGLSALEPWKELNVIGDLG